MEEVMPTRFPRTRWSALGSLGVLALLGSEGVAPAQYVPYSPIAPFPVQYQPYQPPVYVPLHQPPAAARPVAARPPSAQAVTTAAPTVTPAARPAGQGGADAGVMQVGFFPRKPKPCCPEAPSSKPFEIPYEEPESPAPAPALAPVPAPPAEEPAPAAEAPVVDLPADADMGPAVGSGGFAFAAPNMIGDQSGGGCGEASFNGVFAGAIHHPTFGCSRINIAENNSPIPRDRLYFNYNLFRNINEATVFGFSKEFDINRFTFGLEKTFLDGRVSVEARLPFAQQLSSDITIEQYNPSGEPNPFANNLPINQQDTEIGNISLIAKALLASGNTWAFTGGLGLNLPTARDVTIQVIIQDTNFPIPGISGGAASLNVNGVGVIRNETVNLSPYIAGVWSPRPRCFTQGFMQVDVPLNPSELYVDLAGIADAAGEPIPIQGLGTVLPRQNGKIDQQILMRLSWGAGYWVLRDPDASWLTGLAALLEFHYTTALNDAEIINATVVPADAFAPGQPALDFTVGNLANRIDVINLTLGTTAEISNRATVTTAVILPLNQCSCEKPFDWEFQLQLNWRFGPQGRLPNVPPL